MCHDGGATPAEAPPLTATLVFFWRTATEEGFQVLVGAAFLSPPNPCETSLSQTFLKRSDAAERGRRLCRGADE